MQLGIGKTLFPSWSASLTLVKDNGVDAVSHAAAAVKAGDGGSRLDHAVRAMTSFDHAIDNTRKLPVQWFVKNVGTYYRGYAIAKQAVTLLVASGIIPGAKERVGRQTLLAARDAFVSGVEAARTERGRYGRHLAGGWLDATAEDALTAVSMIDQGGVGRELLAGINQVRGQVARGKGLDDRLVQGVSQLFDRAGAQLAELEAAAARVAPRTGVTGDAYAQAGELLAQVEDAAKLLVSDADAAGRELERQAG